MKKTLILCLTLAAMLVSCTKDYKEMIVGSWSFESCSQKVTREDGVVTEQTWRPYYNEKPSISFKSDGTLSGDWCGISPEYVNNNGENILIATTLQWNKYAIQDDRIAFGNDNGFSEIYTIASMSSTEMVLRSQVYPITTYDSVEPVSGTMQTTYRLMKK